MKNIVVISSSLHHGSNSDILARELVRGAEEAGNSAELISLSGKKLGFCTGCFSCHDTHMCAINDDARPIAEKVKRADVVVFATPIYYYEMCGQMKTLIDRMNPLFDSDYRFRDVYLVATAADEDERAMDGAVKGLEGWIECFSRSRLAGVLRGIGIDGPFDASKHPDMLKKAYEMGKAM